MIIRIKKIFNTLKANKKRKFYRIYYNAYYTKNIKSNINILQKG